MVNYSKQVSLVGWGSCVSTQSILIVLFYLSSIILVPSTSADEADDLAFIRKVNPITTPQSQKVVHFNPQETSELNLAATGLIRLYQKFISSQDGPMCNFVPSCSHFGMACIQEFGMVRGLLLTADRLLRCNGSQSRHHYKDGVSGKFIDPVSNYAERK